MQRKVPGTRDILPEEALFWQELEKISREIFSLYNYEEIRTPIIEDASLFNRSLGESTEIVQKQMFLVKNKEELYALRPEGTASIVRAYIENNLDKTEKFRKFYYFGPMFRLERPQKGRLRQFHHIGCEAIGSTSADLDVEVISLAEALLKAFSIKDYKIKINSLGSLKDKKELIATLGKKLKDKLPGLCQDCKARFKKNILRILDCKNDNCLKVISGLEIKDSYLCPQSRDYFTRVKEGLRALKINYEVTPHLVRGLDYYTHTVFEIAHKELGAQDALGAGGRYDNLVKELGGPDLGAIGFAFGVERLLIAKALQGIFGVKSLVYVISLGEQAKQYCRGLLDELRSNKISCDTDYESKTLKGAMRQANDLQARFVLIIGEDELRKGIITLKDMHSSTQEEVKKEEITRVLKERLRC
ncbi:MAG: histidine--tRNA ligase [Candidatus Omnitrophota bacterium]|nr:histidine--tRNA ligase [Candidatus Omnitrophota bacterium]